jgi:three-Cys-motif partner protein
MAMPEVRIGADGLPVTVVGAWTLEKHERLVKYVDITKAVRRKFTRTETTYIELFCGPGRSIVEDDGDTIDGSPIRAARAGKESRVPYTDIHLADADESFVEAVCTRMPKDAGHIHPYVGEAEITVDLIVQRLHPNGLHFAFLDPYKLDPLPFSVIEKLARLEHMDMLVHVSIQDFQRNLRRYMAEHEGPLDRFAPGWRQVANEQETDQKIRIAIFKHWLGLIRNLNMAASEGDEIEKVVGSKRQPLYWLVLVARHPRAHEFWNKIRNVSPQGRLKL